MSKRKAAAARASRRAIPTTPEQLVHKRAGEFWQRFITGATSAKSYRCPGCDQLIAPATPHYVVWPEIPSLLESDGINERRHWHRSCWERHS
ncbi:MAG TPA: hypothetical protein PLQ19_01590 [Aeromicrobium sp.]|nr:hypothetical protein [Aeromicrobium sp.]